MGKIRKDCTSMKNLKEYKTCNCACEQCIGMCKGTPCYGTVEEIDKLIDLGFANKMMMIHTEVQTDDFDWDTFDLITPALKGYEGKYESYYTFGECALLENDLCLVHHTGFKPLEARVANCKIKGGTSALREDIRRMWWESKDAERVVEKWKDVVDYKE